MQLKKFEIEKNNTEKLFFELQEFVQRNLLTVDSFEPLRKIKVVCPNCLKGHLIKTSQEMGFSDMFTKIIYDNFKGECGHNGYYLDGEKLIKLDYKSDE